MPGRSAPNAMRRVRIERETIEAFSRMRAHRRYTPRNLPKLRAYLYTRQIVVRGAAISAYHVQRERRTAGTRDYRAQKVPWILISETTAPRRNLDCPRALHHPRQSCLAIALKPSSSPPRQDAREFPLEIALIV